MTGFEEIAPEPERRASGGSVSIMGELPDDPDQFPITPPAGFIWVRGSAWSGSCEMHGIADMRVCLNDELLDLVLSVDDVRALRALLDRAIEESGVSATDGQAVIGGGA